MRIVFMGTPDFAQKSLERLYDDGYEICGVFTQPDKPKNRGMKMVMSPVKELALSHGTPVYQPATLKDGEALNSLKALKADMIAVVAYGKLLPKEILELPALGCINIHGSILPKYRGSAPVQWAVLNGDAETGVTSMYMAEAMDAGDIIKIKKTAVGEDETAGELYERLGFLGAALLSETIAAIRDGEVESVQQKDDEVTYAPPLSKDLSPIDWNKTAREICNQIRGLNPWPVATSVLGDVKFKIFKAEPTVNMTGTEPGTIIRADKEALELACADGTVLIHELQAPGGKRMRAVDYLRGHPICL